MSSGNFHPSATRYYAAIIEKSTGGAPLQAGGPSLHGSRRTYNRSIPTGPLDYDFSYTDEEKPHDGDYYYVRVKQLDGDMAQSSPWWVGGIPPR